uniref:hypothetical protein n=1 Tax=Gordonia sp. B7-2 TaxID=3420932 RepID=UPI003D91EC81
MTSSTRITRLSSDLSRLGRESEMLDAIVSMMSAERLAAPTAAGTPRSEVIGRLADDGFALAAAVRSALGDSSPGEGSVSDDVCARFREAHRAFSDAAAGLGSAAPDTVVAYADLDLAPGEVVPQRIAEVVLAHDALDSVWTIDEADPDSVLDALDAMVRRLERSDDIPPITLATLEGDRWELSGGGQRIYGTRESLAQWLARGVDGVVIEGEDPQLPRWH